MSKLLEVVNVNKYFGQQHALKDINFEIESGEFISLLGPSGCGKTTLLRALMGLEWISTGNIYLNGEDITDFAPVRRGFSIVFQDYALFPHMTLYDNVAYGLKLRKTPPAQIKERVMDTLELLHLEKAVKKYPTQLSGGMQQRAAIARALVLDSRVILMDEPFSALDAMVKVDLSAELKDLQKQFGITIVMVTHDQEEALSLSDRVMLMNRGELVVSATPEELYKNAEQSEFVQSFIVDQINKRAQYIFKLRRGDVSR